MKKIIGLVGETGSGKDTFCQTARKLVSPVFCFRFSDPLSEVLGIFFDEIKKQDQQWLAAVLRERFGNNILGEAIGRKIKQIKKGWVILNGIRAKEEYQMIKSLGGKIIYITADSKIRWQRVQGRGEKKDDAVSYQQFLEMEKAKTEILIAEIGRQSDHKVENNGSIKNFKKQCSNILRLLNT